MNYEKLYEIIELYDYVSFDIFDTLIKRDIVDPKDIFSLIEKKIYNMNINIYDYKNKRIEAERIAREKSGQEEVTLSLIYDFFQKENSEYDKEIISTLKKLEEKAEIEVSIINLNMKPILDYCKDKKKKIVLISDMYLEKKTIEDILEKSNIIRGRDYIKLFLSSDIGYTKRSGKLYDNALEYLNIKPEKLLHIGDALKSDYLIPIIKGIKSYHIANKVNNSNYKYLKHKDKKRRNNELYLDKFISNRILKIDNDYEKFGYECIGPLLYNFSIWLHRNIEKDKCKAVNFLAREGLLLQEAFKIIYPTKETRYLCVSRKSIIGAMLGRVCSIEERLRMIKVPHAFDKYVIIDLLGLNVKEFKKNISSNKIYHSIEEVINDKEFLAFLKSRDEEIVKKSEVQMKFLRKYLSFEKEANDIPIVDIGWNGTMQYYLEKLLSYNNQNKKIKGYYIGVSKLASNKYLKLKRYGYLFDSSASNIQIDENKIFAFGGLFESIFTANHGSVKKYYENNSEIVPIFYEYEYEDNYKIISKIQKGALNFVEDYSKSGIKDIIIMDSQLVSSKILRVGNYPRKKDLKMFETLDFFDVKKTKMIGKVNIFKQPIKDVYNEFLISGWKVGFIKQMMCCFPASGFYCKYRKSREKRNG